MLTGGKMFGFEMQVVKKKKKVVTTSSEQSNVI